MCSLDFWQLSILRLGSQPTFEEMGKLKLWKAVVIQSQWSLRECWGLNPAIVTQSLVLADTARCLYWVFTVEWMEEETLAINEMDPTAISPGVTSHSLLYLHLNGLRGNQTGTSALLLLWPHFRHSVATCGCQIQWYTHTGNFYHHPKVQWDRGKEKLRDWAPKRT